MYIVACLAVLLAAYLLNVVTVSVLYHRGLAHGAVTLHPALRKFVVHAGIWLTGLDPKAWVCMHRRHHLYSDTEEDPHSPVHYGLIGVLMGQLKSYEKTLIGLAKRNVEYTSLVEDLEFPTHWLNRKRIWYVPYVLHLAIGLGVGAATGMWLLGLAYYFGMMSHPIEGWVVNSLGHAVGGRNFDTPDNSRNNHLAAWLILGEGFQNNHHAHPRSARFSYRRAEVDLGYAACLTLEMVGALEIDKEHLLAKPSETLTEQMAS